jgi:hypothetical protein
LLRYLHGLLLLAGDCPEAAPVRDALMQIEVGDRQLELIAKGQIPQGGDER